MKHSEWLAGLLPQWREEGLVTAEAAETLRKRYATEERRTPLWFIFLGSVGALLVGLGVITLFAANWKDIGRPARAALSFVPLALSVGLYGAGLWRKWHEKNGFMEVAGILWGLSVGACIALISQTYQISSDGRTFVLVWTLLLLPVMIATRSFVVTAGYYTGALIWMGMSLGIGTERLWAVAMAAAGLPIALHIMRDSEAYRVRGIILRWLLLILGCVGYGFLFNYSGGHSATYAVFMYGLLFAALTQTGFLRPDNAERGKRPWAIIGILGSITVTMLYAFGSFSVRYSSWFYHGSVLNYGLFAVMLLLLVAAGVKAVMRWRKCRKNLLYPLAYLVVPLFCLQLLPIREAFGRRTVHTYLDALLYLVALGIFTLVYGISERKIARANLGMLIVLSVILERFTESSLPLTAKAIIFIVAGIGFFALSWFMGKRFSKKEACHA